MTLRLCIATFGLAILAACSPKTIDGWPVHGDTLDLRGAATACRVHGCPLLEGKQAAMPTLSVTWEPEYEEARSRLFPITAYPPYGIDDVRVKWALVRYCPQCR